MKLCNKCKGDQPTGGATIWVVGKCEACGREGGVSEFPENDAVPGGKNGGKNSGDQGAPKGEAPVEETPATP